MAAFLLRADPQMSLLPAESFMSSERYRFDG